MSFENGWRATYDIGKVIKGSNIICDKCGKKIRSLYLRKLRTNFKHRGNETDETYFYHKSCKLNHKIWDEHKREIEQIKIKEYEYKKKLEEVIDLMEKNNISISDLEQC